MKYRHTLCFAFMLIQLSCSKDALMISPHDLESPPLLSPGQMQCVANTQTPTFSWEEVPYATGYTLQIANDRNMDDKIYESSLLTTTYLTITQELTPGSYWWRVLVQDNQNQHNSSASNKFTILYGLSPIAIEPIELSRCVTTPTFSWRDPDYQEGVVYYNVKIIHTSTGVSVLSFFDLSQRTLQLQSQQGQQLLSENNYTVQVERIYNGCLDPIISSVQFKVPACKSPLTLDKPQIILPTAYECVDGNDAIIIQWNPVDDADYYEVQIADSIDFSHILLSVSTEDNTMDIPNTFNAQQLFIKVIAIAGDNQSSSTTITIINVSKVSSITDTSIQAWECGSKPYLSWADSNTEVGSVDYNVVISSDVQFTIIIHDEIVVDGTSFIIPSNIIDTTVASEYFYNITKIKFNCPTHQSLSGSFTTQATPASPVNLQATWEGCGPSDYTVTFSWEDGSSDIYPYQLIVTSPSTGSQTYQTNDTYYTLTLDQAETYQWEVRAKTIGCDSLWTQGPDIHLGAGQTWQRQYPSTSIFTPREGHGTIVHPSGQALWVMAGNSAGDKSDVWTTQNGSVWTQLISQAAFGTRRWFGTTYFDNRMWVIAGNKNASSTNLNDIWYSYDGTNWTEAQVIGTHFSARHGPVVLTYKNKLWVIGGEGPNCTCRNDVWSSSDGINWELVTSNAGFPTRDWHSGVVFKDRMWILGGIDRSSNCSYPTYLNDVYSSSDGVNWDLEVDLSGEGPFPARGGHTSVVFDGKIWVIGGTAAWPALTQSDVWYSEDGSNWCQATNAFDFSNRYGSTSATFLDKM